MAKPNLFIVGAPKSGTTALTRYLSEHPCIFMYSEREPHFFTTDMPNRRTPNTLEEYLALFSKANNSHLIIGEKSVHYLRSREAIKNIRDFNEDAKLIVMLRNPVEMVYAMHAQALISGNEDVEDFAEAWVLETERLRGKRLPKNCRDATSLYYSQIAKYAEQLKRLYVHFPERQVKIILFEDFTSDTASVYRSVLEFLGVPADGRQSFSRINESKKATSPLLSRFTQTPPRAMKAVAISLKRLLGVEKLGTLDLVRKYNFKAVKRRPLNEELRHEIIETYKADVEELAGMLKRDLRHWME